MKIKRFEQFVNENYSMGRQDLISIILELTNEYSEEELNQMDDDSLDRIYNDLDEEKINVPSGAGGFFPKTKASGVNYTGGGGSSGLTYTGGI